MSSENREIKIGAMISYLGIFFSLIAGLLYNPWMIKTIGNSDYGLYTLSMSVVNTFLIDFGLSMATQRFVANYIAQKDQKKINNIVGLILKLYIFISCILMIIFVCIYFFIDDIYIQLTLSELFKFKLLYALVVCYSVISFPFVVLNGVLSAYGKFIALKSFDLLCKVISITLIVLALLNGAGVYALVIVNLFANIFVTILKIIIVKKYTPLEINYKFFDVKKIKELFSFSIWTSISTMVMRLLLTLSPSILGMMSGSYQIAIMGYAVSLEGYIYTFVNAINGFFLPRLSRISVENNSDSGEQVLTLMVRVGRIIFILYGLIYIGFLTMGRSFIELIIGSDYIDSYYCTLLICMYGIIAYPQQIANTYIIVMNKVKKRAYISLLTLIVYVVLAFPMSKIGGAVGICGSICIALCVQTIIVNVMYYKDLKINIVVFFKECHFKCILGTILSLILAIIISLINVEGWFGFFLKVILIICMYFLICWKFTLKQSEKKLVCSIFNRKG